MSRKNFDKIQHWFIFKLKVCGGVSANFFYEEPDSKYLRFCGPCGFCDSYSALHCSVKATTGNMGMAVFITKMGDGLDLLLGSVLFTSGIRDTSLIKSIYKNSKYRV